MNNRVALYIRLSVEDSKVESLSIENQKLALHRFVEYREDMVGAEVTEFVDNGYSGTNFERPAVQELLDQVREGKICCIIVKDFSRFGRDSLEVGYFMERVFPIYGVRFISLNDQFDSGDLHNDTGGLNVAITYLINEFYSRDLSMKYKSAKYVKFQRGEYQSKICPYGYQKGADGRMEPDPDTAPVVQMIFELAAHGESSTAIIRELYNREIATPGEYKKQKGQANHDVSRSGGIWQKSTIARILQDERYTGTYIIGKREVIKVGGHHVRMKDESQWIKVSNHHQAIISKELYDHTQSIFRREACVKKVVHQYPLRGKVFCGCCAHTMERSDQKTPRFVCRHSQVVEDAPCHGLTIMEAELEQVIYDIIEKQAQIILSVSNCDNPIIWSARVDQKTECDRQIADVQLRKRMLYEQLVQQELSESKYKEQKKTLDAELSRLLNVQSALAAQLSQHRADEHTKSANRELAQLAVGEGRLTTDLVDALIVKVEVYPNNRMEIVWKIKSFGLEGVEAEQK